MLFGQLAIGAADVIRRRRARDAKCLVGVLQIRQIRCPRCAVPSGKAGREECANDVLISGRSRFGLQSSGAFWVQKGVVGIAVGTAAVKGFRGHQSIQRGVFGQSAHEIGVGHEQPSK